MDNPNALQQLAPKKRAYEDLGRFIGERASGAPNYCLLLGAGCSVSSNIRSATDLVNLWREEVFVRLYPDEPYSEGLAKKRFAEQQSSWYNSAREYPCLFEKNYDLPRQRRMFVEQEVAGKKPNLGYVYLIRLIESGYFNTVFTTNFDDLLNEAFFQFSNKRPIVCAHDSSISSVTVTSKRPKIIKLHGDYLFDDIKSTVRETESLEENTRKKFIEFGRDFGLIVAGYGGCDRSIMDVLHYLLRSEDYLKHGVYWCIKKGTTPSDELVKLLWRDRVYFVEIDGYDELMASLYADLLGDALPIDTSIITDKPRKLIAGFCENLFLSKSPSSIIKRDLSRLRRQDEHEELLSVFRTARNSSDDESRGTSELRDTELAKIIQIKHLIRGDDLPGARASIEAQLAMKPSREFSTNLLLLRVELEEAAGDLVTATKAVDELIAEDPNDTSFYVRKTDLVLDHQQRMEVLRIAEAANPYSARVFDRKAKCLIDAYWAGVGSKRSDLLSEIESAVDKSLSCDPSLGNHVWNRVIDFYEDAMLPREDFRTKLDMLIAQSQKIGENRLVFLRARLCRYAKYKEDRKSSEADSLLSDIARWKQKSSRAMQPDFEWLELDALRRLERRAKLSSRISELDVHPDYSSEPEFLRRKANFMLSSSGDLQSAIVTVNAATARSRDRKDIMRLAQMLSYAHEDASIGELVAKFFSSLKPLDRVMIRQLEYDARGDIEAELNQLRGSYPRRIVGVEQRLAEVHSLLLLRRYSEAADVAKAALETVVWSKSEYGPLIINYEIAQLRNGAKVDKGRLRQVLEATDNEDVKGCCYFLLGDLEKSREIFRTEMRRDREKEFIYRQWAIFADERGRDFLDALIKTVA